MNFVTMTNEEWEEVRRQHDSMVEMGQRELQTEAVRACAPAGYPQAATQAVERKLRELDDLVISLSH